MSLSTDFLTTQNISLLWDILSEGDIIKNSQKQYVEHVFKVFKANLRGFYDVESKKNTQLVDMNKKYILLILNYLNNSHKEPEATQVVPQKPSGTSPLVTAEEIQNNRQIQFEKDLNRHQTEFTNAMTVPVPPVPDFSIKLDDEPIKEIAEKIRQMTVSRNYDIEQITKTHANSQQNWLKPAETSIKAEKLSLSNANAPATTASGLKYIKIDNYEMDGNMYKSQIIDLNRQESNRQESKKHISWEDENIKINRTDAIETEIENSIFAKLKKIETPFIEKKEDVPINLHAQMQHIHTRIDILNDNVAKIMELLNNKNETI